MCDHSLVGVLLLSFCDHSLVGIYAFFITEWPDDASVPARMMHASLVLFFFVTCFHSDFNVSSHITLHPPSEASMTRGRSASRKRSVRGRSQTGWMLRQPCRYYLKGTCTRSLCEYWHPPECQILAKLNRDAKQVTSVSVPELQGWRTTKWKAEEELSKRKKNDDKGAVAVVKTVPQWGCVSQDSEPSELPKKRDVSEKPEA